jgi:hypothetical protein
MATNFSSMLDALKAEGPAADRVEHMALYGWLIGAWDVEVLDRDADGAIRSARGEWHFDWVLEGRAIQDVFIVPRRPERQSSERQSSERQSSERRSSERQSSERQSDGMAVAGNRYGTTLRVPNPEDGTWRIDWSNPVTQARSSMIARKRGDEIVQDGVGTDGVPYRWIFSEISANAFHWRAEVSSDEARGWTTLTEFRATRATT